MAGPAIPDDRAATLSGRLPIPGLTLQNAADYGLTTALPGAFSPPAEPRSLGMRNHANWRFASSAKTSPRAISSS